MMLVVCEFPAYLHMEGTTFVVGQPYVYAVKSGHFEQELLSIIPLSKAL
jgi:hypothetical protein